MPGKSNAFEISRRLGLPENLIDDAKKLLSSDSVRFEDVIANAEYHRQVAEREREIARQASAETVKLRDEAEKLRKQMEDQRENTIKKAKADARRIMEQTRRESESIIADLKRMKKEQQNPDAQVNAIRRRIENNVDNLSEGLLQKVDTGCRRRKSARATRWKSSPSASGNGACPRQRQGRGGGAGGHPEAEGEHQPAAIGEAAGQAEAPADERSPENRRDGTHGADGMRRARHGAR